MAHGTRISGTQKSVTAGFARIDGVNKKITKGLTLVGGVQHEICFVSVLPVFSDNDWSAIIAACHSGSVPDTWKIGDSKPMTIGGTSYQIDIIGMGHDEYSDGSGRAPLTLQMHDSFGTGYAMNSTSSKVNSWESCDGRTTHLPYILSQMPSEVRIGIRGVSKKTSAGNKSTTIITTTENLFLPSADEVGGLSEGYGDEGTQYAYYSAGNGLIKKLNGTAEPWWTRSPNRGSDDRFQRVSASGGIGYGIPTFQYGLAVAFCF